MNLIMLQILYKFIGQFVKKQLKNVQKHIYEKQKMNIIQKAEKKPDPKAAALPFYKRFTYPFTRKQVDNMLMMSLRVMMLVMMVILRIEAILAGSLWTRS